MIFAAWFLMRTLGQLEIHRFYQNALAGVLVLVAAYPTILVLAIGTPATSNPVQPCLEDLQKFVPQNQIIVSDVPWAVAWYSERSSIWFPQGTDDYRRIENTIAPLNVICLTSMMGTYSPDEKADAWKQMYFRGQAPAGFKLARAYQEGMLVFARAQVPTKAR
jgi:hypothetical protein